MDSTVEHKQLANDTLPTWLGREGTVNQTEISPKLRTQISKYLKNQGYELTEEAKLLGKSGIEHTFDIVAERSDGFTSHVIAICIAAGGNRETELGTILLKPSSSPKDL